MRKSAPDAQGGYYHRDEALLCISPGHTTLPRKQPCGRENVIENSGCVINGSWSILTGSRGVIITRVWAIVIKGWSITARSWRIFDRTYTCYFAGGRTFYYGWGRTGCTTSRDSQYEIQSKRQRDLQQQTRPRSIGDNPPDHVYGFHLHR